jgi:hypothetical protein
LAFSVAAGSTAALCPAFGTAAGICLAMGLTFRLNHGLLQAINFLLYPAQLALFPLFAAGGALLLKRGESIIPFAEIPARLGSDPFGALAEVGWVIGSAVLIWLAIAPLVGVALYYPLRKLFRRLRREH